MKDVGQAANLKYNDFDLREVTIDGEEAPFSLSFKLDVACADEKTVNALEIVTGGTPDSSSGGSGARCCKKPP